MPKTTFHHLSEEKRQAVVAVLIHEFESYPLPDATVKHIVDALGIARGSFYQYFDSLTESYFYVLEREVIETHSLFLKLFHQCHRDTMQALEIYGEVLAKEIFQGKHYALYKNRYLYWNASLERDWRNYLAENQKDSSPMESMNENEPIRFVKAIIHALMQRLFMENWDRETFLKRYHQHIQWIKGGLTNVSPD
mgnify:FL=1